MNDLKQKTIFVIVHTSDMLTPAGTDIIMEVKKTLTNTPLIYSKTIWTNVIENTLEYIRIVYDLFSTERRIGLVSVDTKEKIWIDPEDANSQNWRSWMKTTTEIGPPQNAYPSLSPDTIPGLKSIINLLASNEASKIHGLGRVIIIGYKMNDLVEKWGDEIQTVLECHNGQEHEPMIVNSEWYFIDVEQFRETNINTSLIQENPILITNKSQNINHKIYRQSVYANKGIQRCLMSLLEKHHDLACTLVQNIPMKEDTTTSNNANNHNAAQQNSAMYGVELIHCRKAFSEIELCGLINSMKMSHKTFCGFSSCVGIKWVTPRQTQDIDYYNTKSAYRVTTADVCNRASCCLANFVLEGRSVVLEIDSSLLSNNLAPESPAQEVMLLTSHSGLLYIHSLPVHLDPTSYFLKNDSNKFQCITDLSYKKHSNKLRINDFCQLILASRLAPNNNKIEVRPDICSDELQMYTRYWPELINDTLIFNKPVMPKIIELLMKKKLEFSDKSNCIAFLQQLIFDQSQSDKTASKKQLLENKTFKTELELLLRLYKDRSPSHQEVYTSFEGASANLPGLVDFNELLKETPASCNDAPLEVYSGLTKMDQLLNKSGEKLKMLLTTKKDKNSSNEKAEHSKPNRKRFMTLREHFSENYRYANRNKQRIQFAGEISAINNFTELYQGLISTSSTVTNNVLSPSSGANSLSATVLSAVADIVSSTNIVPSVTSMSINASNINATVSGAPVDPRK